MKSLTAPMTARPGRMASAIDRSVFPHVGECDGSAAWRASRAGDGPSMDEQHGHAAFRTRHDAMR